MGLDQLLVDKIRYYCGGLKSTNVDEVLAACQWLHDIMLDKESKEMEICQEITSRLGAETLQILQVRFIVIHVLTYCNLGFTRANLPFRCSC